MGTCENCENIYPGKTILIDENNRCKTCGKLWKAPKISKFDFGNNKEDCPWHNDGDCKIQVSYNQHVNDPRFSCCEEHSCAVLFWLSLIIGD